MLIIPLQKIREEIQGVIGNQMVRTSPFPKRKTVKRYKQPEQYITLNTDLHLPHHKFSCT